MGRGQCAAGQSVFSKATQKGLSHSTSLLLCSLRSQPTSTAPLLFPIAVPIHPLMPFFLHRSPCSEVPRTDSFSATQSEADAMLYRSTFGTQKPGGALANALDVQIKNSANTHLIAWYGNVFAMFEAGSPHRLDPESLETVGLDTMQGTAPPGLATTTGSEDLDKALKFGRSHTAHPHADPVTGRLVGFTWATEVCA